VTGTAEPETEWSKTTREQFHRSIFVTSSRHYLIADDDSPVQAYHRRVKQCSSLLRLRAYLLVASAPELFTNSNYQHQHHTISSSSSSSRTDINFANRSIYQSVK